MMFTKPKAKAAFAKAMAYQEAGYHLDLTWTDDLEETKQGRLLACRFFRLAEEWLSRAHELEKE